jgi:hypothetical protein
MSILRELWATLTDADFHAHPLACLWQLVRLALGLVHDNTVAPWPSPPELSPREKRILSIAHRKPCISQNVLQPYFDVTPEAIRLSLSHLVRCGLLERRGTKRSTTYILPGMERGTKAVRGGVRWHS